ncbi:general odorant-binding protein 69a [Microplitis demolitor]|uniref:general odorant-binding protein 69a n=1 Tax=Microplitis demolitor TaxID=69319 RepID=UPI0004400321|nr:general odorant-binding protein 69a [Microplitis demolitor]
MYRLAVVFIFASVLVLSESAITAEDLMKFGMARRTCDRTTGVDPSIIDRVLQGEMVNDPQFDCHVGCVLKELNLLTADGSLNVEVAASKVPENLPFHDQLVNAIRSCGSRKGNDQCETAHMLFVCFHENNIPNLIMG